MKYIILAGGKGSRLSKEGQAVSKPMTPIFNKPMIGRLIELLKVCKAEEILVVINKDLTDALQYLRLLSLTSSTILKIISVPSINNFFSLRQGYKALQGKFIAITVDSILPTTEFLDFVSESEKLDNQGILMGITSFVDDESPLYVNVENGVITDYHYGGEPFPSGVFVSAGVYAFSTDIMDMVCKIKEPQSLNEMQKILANNKIFKVLPFEFSKAMDVDHLSDIAKAENFLSLF